MSLIFLFLVGADVQVLFDCVFVDFEDKKNRSATAQNILQMVGRFRNLSCWEVLLLYNELPHYYAGLTEDFKQQMTQKTDFSREWGDLVSRITHKKLEFKTPNYMDKFECHERADGVIELTPHWFSRLYLVESVDKNQSQEYLLYAHARQSGWEVYLDEQPQNKTKATKEMQAAKQKKRHEDDKEQELAFQALQSIKSVDEMTEIAKNGSEVSKTMDTRTSKVLSETAHVLKYYVNESNDDASAQTAAEKMTHQDFKKAKKFSSVVFALAKAQSQEYTDKDEALADLKQAPAFFDLNGKMTAKHKEEVKNVMTSLGIVEPHVACNLSVETVKANAKAMCDMSDKLTIARGQQIKKDRSKKPDNTTRRAVTRFSNELKQLFGTHIEPYRSHGSLVYYKYQPFKDIQTLVNMGNHRNVLKRIHDQNEQTTVRKRTREEENEEMKHIHDQNEQTKRIHAF